MEYADASDSKVLPAGNYSITDTKYDWMKGSITVTDENSTGNEIVGGFYSPSHQVSNNLDNDGIMHPGWLATMRVNSLRMALMFLKKYNFNYNTCTYCANSGQIIRRANIH